VTWPAADLGGIPPEGGIAAAYKRQPAEAADPVALRAEINARIESVRGPIGALNKFQTEELIDPRDTRRLACEWVGTAYCVCDSGQTRSGRSRHRLVGRSPMDWGIHLPHLGRQATRKNLLEFAQLADQVGYHSGWVSDHVAWPKDIASRYPYTDDGSFAPPM